MELTLIQQKIYEIRGHKVMLDFDIAALYEVETKVLNQAVKRNISRFPEDFMFSLSKEEWHTLRSHFATLETKGNNWSQFVTSSTKHRGLTYLPYAFTEHGVTMLASVLRSEKAINMNIAIVRAFIALRQFSLNYKDIVYQVNEIRRTVSSHSEQLNQIYDAIENMMDEKAGMAEAEEKWRSRERIGFRKK